MADPARITIRIPDDHELAVKLSASKEIEERIAYVRGLLLPASRAADAIDAAYRRMDSMEAELTALRAKVGSLSTTDRAAVEARYAMIGQMHKARNLADQLERDLRDLKAALKKPT